MKDRARGTALRTVELGPAASLVLGGEIAPGRVAVALMPFEAIDESAATGMRSSPFVDVATGAVSPGPDGLVPADRFTWWFSPVLPPAEAGLAFLVALPRRRFGASSVSTPRRARRRCFSAGASKIVPP